MDTIFLFNQNNDRFPTDVVRYFKLNYNKYFIFTLNETDENGYVQLYVSRIENDYGKLAMRYISDENEWNSFKQEIQNIVTNNRNGIKYTNDLDFSELDGMVVTEFRIFKLKKDVVGELGKNKNAVKINEPKTLEAASAQNNNLTIEEILREVSNGAQRAKNEVKVEPKNIDEEINKEFEDLKSSEYDVDYKIKYNNLLDTVKSLEDENIKLINELVEYKAKLETIKDIIN